MKNTQSSENACSKHSILIGYISRFRQSSAVSWPEIIWKIPNQVRMLEASILYWLGIFQEFGRVQQSAYLKFERYPIQWECLQQAFYINWVYLKISAEFSDQQNYLKNTQSSENACSKHSILIGYISRVRQSSAVS